MECRKFHLFSDSMLLAVYDHVKQNKNHEGSVLIEQIEEEMKRRQLTVKRNRTVKRG